MTRDGAVPPRRPSPPGESPKRMGNSNMKAITGRVCHMLPIAKESLGSATDLSCEMQIRVRRWLILLQTLSWDIDQYAALATCASGVESLMLADNAAGTCGPPSAR